MLELLARRAADAEPGFATKQVRPIFIEEETEIVVITVYTYYF